MAGELDISGVVADLVSAPYPGDPDGCWVFARRVLERGGFVLPPDQAVALAAEAALGCEVARGQAWDVVILKGEGDQTRPHVGVMLNPRRFIHATRGGARIDRLDVWKKLGAVVRMVRLSPRSGT